MDKQPLPAKGAGKRRPLTYLIGLAVVAGGIAGAYLYLFHPPKPWVVRWQLGGDLAKKAATKDFKVEFPFPSKAEMAKAAPKTEGKSLGKGAKTGKDFDTLKAEYIKLKTAILTSENQLAEVKRDLAFRQTQLDAFNKQLAEAQAENATNVTQLQTWISNTLERVAAINKDFTNLTAQVSQNPAREKELEPIVSDLWEFQRLWAAEQKLIESRPENVLAKGRAQLSQTIRKELDSAKTWAAIYKAIGKELFVADRLLESANVEHRRMGLGIVLQAVQHALDDAQDLKVAGMICQGYIWPNLDAAEDNRRSQLSLENLLNTCANTFRQNSDNDLVVRNWELLLGMSSTPQRTDWARSQLAFAHEANGDYKAALENLKSIQATNDYRWAMRMIPRLEERVKYNEGK